MRSVDTNVVIRLIVGDDPAQTEVAQAILVDGIFVSHGVLMETEWVLRSFYRWRREQIGDALLDLLELQGVRTLHTSGLIWALDRFRQGADWADMLHLIAARGTTSFATFDNRIAQQAGTESPVAIEQLI